MVKRTLLPDSADTLLAFGEAIPTVLTERREAREGDVGALWKLTTCASRAS
jgi:hypothetical protein